jgi:thioredoxin 1
MKKLRELMNQSKEEKGVITLNASNFDKTLNDAKLPVLVDFWAEWCLPCRIMAPIIEELSREYADKAVFAKLNVDENPEIASRHQAMSIPLFIIFKNGQPVESIVGAVGRRPLEDALKKYL